MKNDTKQQKHANEALRNLIDGGGLGSIIDLLEESKSHFDDVLGRFKLILVEFLLSAEREILTGPDYLPSSTSRKWGSQGGSVYVGGERLKVSKPRIRENGKEVQLSVYEALKQRSSFSQEILTKALKGISTREYGATLHSLLDNFGISKSSVSRHLVAATTEQLQELRDRSLEMFDPFAIFIDGYHLAGEVFVVALGLDMQGKKQVLGFWEGATENHTICQELLTNLEDRKLPLSDNILYVTDGGTGIIKALKERFGKRLIHQRCQLHKERNLQRHLPKKYREELHSRFKRAINCHLHQDAQEEINKLEKWLEKINPSAAESLREGQEELLTVHRLGVPPLLRKTLRTTNPIESMFSQTSHGKRNIKNIKTGKKMPQRWMGACLLHAESKFRTVKGYLSIIEVNEKIKVYQMSLSKIA